ncbi:hypothetical protein DASC09_006950 [Saccharomycopsis crataegensis]|uniref:Uncharacterized protein n=1 Tax=Saccharomycopsis crataegensis TaxID=43959 RepID=A0AAV5QEJ3_9ASCO|nr:hypothetical protein DASC09_006950 [Saccharomycopsis crataegensis]
MSTEEEFGAPQHKSFDMFETHQKQSRVKKGQRIKKRRELAERGNGDEEQEQGGAIIPTRSRYTPLKRNRITDDVQGISSPARRVRSNGLITTQAKSKSQTKYNSFVNEVERQDNKDEYDDDTNGSYYRKISPKRRTKNSGAKKIQINKNDDDGRTNNNNNNNDDDDSFRTFGGGASGQTNSSFGTVSVPLKSTPGTSASKFRRIPTPARTMIQRSGKTTGINSRNISTPIKLVNYDSSFDNSGVVGKREMLLSSIKSTLNTSIDKIGGLGSRQATAIASEVTTPRISSREFDRPLMHNLYPKNADDDDYNEDNKFERQRILEKDRNKNNGNQRQEGLNTSSQRLALKTDFYISTVDSLNKRITKSKTKQDQEITNHKKRQYEESSASEGDYDSEATAKVLKKLDSLPTKKLFMNEEEESDSESIFEEMDKTKKKMEMAINTTLDGAAKIAEINQSTPKINTESSTSIVVAKPNGDWTVEQWKKFAKLVKEARLRNDSSLVYNVKVLEKFHIASKIELNLRIELVKHLILGLRMKKSGVKRRKLA